MTQQVDRLMKEGRLALRRGDGAAARAAFTAALEKGRTGEVLEDLGKAAYLLLDLDETIDCRHAAYAEYRRTGLGAGAVRVACKVASLHGTYRGDWAVASGWIARAKDLLSGVDAVQEEGWVALAMGCSTRTGP